MDESRYASLLSRRSMIAATAIGGMAFASRPAAFTQPATPEVAGTVWPDHQIVGVWHADLVAGSKPSTMMFDADGTFVEYDPDPLFGLGLGLWVPRDDEVVEVVYIVQRPARFEEDDPVARMFAAGYIPEPLAFLPVLVRFRLSFKVRGAGDEFHAFGSMEVRDGDSNILAGPFSADDVEGIRLIPAVT